MENKASEGAATGAIGIGSQFNTSKAIRTHGNQNKASRVSHTVSKHIHKAIRDAESKLNVSFPAEGTKPVNEETEYHTSDSTPNRSCKGSRENVTSIPRKVWVQEWTKENPHNQPWHGLALSGLLPDARSCKSWLNDGKESLSGQSSLLIGHPSSGGGGAGTSKADAGWKYGRSRTVASDPGGAIRAK